MVVVKLLQNVSSPPVAPLKEKLRSKSLPKGSILKLAGALAQLEAKSDTWPQIEQSVADALLAIATGQVDYWTQTLKPVRDRLKPYLEREFGDTRSSPAARQFSSTILALLFRDDADVLAKLAVRGDRAQQRELVRSLQPHAKAAIETLKKIEASIQDLPKVEDKDLEKLVSSSIIRFHLGDRGQLWSRMKMTPDPTVRTELFLQLQAFDVPVLALFEQLQKEKRPSCR